MFKLTTSVESHEDLTKVTDDILREVGMEIGDSGGEVTFAGKDPVRKTVVKVAGATSAVLAANAVADAAIWKERTGEGQDVHVDLRKAWIEQSPWQIDAAPYTLINGTCKTFNINVVGIMNPLLPTRDGRFMAICPIYPSQQRKFLSLLNCGPAEEQMRQATIKRDALEIEAAAEVAQIPIHMVRTAEEFAATEQGKIQAEMPLIHIEKIGESDPIPLPDGERPLSGLKVLNMVHAVAGPCVQRALTAQGAEALNLNMPDWVEYENFFFQADVGMKQAYLDARKPENRQKVYDLVKDADVFVENLKPGLLDREGYSAGALAERKPGIIYVSVKMMAHEGPWSHWAGFDVNAAGVVGWYTAEGTPDQPMLPQQVNVVCDILTGYMGAIGVKAALLRRAKEGGSYKVSVSLSQTAAYMMSLGLNNKEDLANLESMGPDHQIVKPNIQVGETPFGEFTRAGSQVEKMKTPQYWADPMLYVPGSSKAEWDK
jgi:crotonobetainyl-CoA:carnitine CoA-transferase CaiB-like acyl-CoA transferase